MIRSPPLINKPIGNQVANFIIMLLRLLYSLLIYLALPVILGRQLLRSRKDAGHRQRWSERLGFVKPLNQTDHHGRIIHFHLVSVGETLAALPLIRLWMQQQPNDRLHITCMTLTGSREIQKRLQGDNITHSYLPYDLPDAMNRFYKRVPATITVIMETELWPNLVHQAKHNGVKTLVMNARLSERSYKRYAAVRAATACLLQPLNKICCQTQATYDRFAALGATKEQLVLSGNLKFDMDISSQIIQQGEALRTQLGTERPVWIAGSTHEGEDQILLQAHQLVRQQISDAVLILVPRHPERFNQVARLIEQHHFEYARRSNNEAAALSSIQVLLGDTMGELMALYQASDIAFVGGSLIERGGHNPLEPVALSKPVLSGPHVFNFTEVYDMLSQENAMAWGKNSAEIADHLVALFEQPNQAKTMSETANKILQRHQGAKQMTLEAIASQLVQAAK